MSVENNWQGSALEGVPYVGKTTTLWQLGQTLPQSEIVVVPEYSIIGNLPKFPPADWEDVQKAIGKIIDLEKRRTNHINDRLAKNKGALVIFDRGPVSCIVFQYVASSEGYLGNPIGMAEAFTKEFNEGELILPLGYAHITLPQSEIEARETVLLSIGHRKNISFLRQPWITQKFITCFNKFLSYLPSNLAVSISTQNKLPEQVAREVLNFVQKQPTQVVVRPDFMKFAYELIYQK